MAWYPVYWPTKPQRLVDTTGCVAWEVLWTPFGSKPAQNLLGCGMLASRNLAPLFDDRRSTLQAISRSLESELLIRKPTVL